MKRLLLLLLIALPFTIKAQTTILKADTVSAWIGNNQLPINSFYASWSDSAVSFIKLDGTPIIANKKYNLWTDVMGTPFTSMSSLKAWVKQYFFVNASNASGSGGAITPTIATTDTITISQTGTYTFTGTTAKSWKMPTVSNATGMTFFIINRGTAALTVNSNSGGNDLDVSGVYSGFIVLQPGENYVLRGNSLKLVSVNN